MKRGTKAVLGTLVVLIALLAIVLAVVIFYLGNVVKTAVETVGPTFTGGTVTLEHASVRPLRGHAMLKDLVVGNPEGFKTPSAIELGEFRVSLAPRSVLSSQILIHEVIIDGPVITLEMDGLKGNNLSAIQRNVEKASPAAAPEGEPPPAEAPAAAESAKRVVIENLIIRNGKVRISSGAMLGSAITVPLPTIHLRDIGKEKETSISEAVTLVLSEVVNTVLAAVLKAPEFAGKGLKLLGDFALDGGKVVGQTATGLAGGTVEVTGHAARGAVSAVGNAASGVVGVVDGAAGAVGDGAAAAGHGLKKLGSGLGGILKRGAAEGDASAPTNAPGD